MQFISKGGGGRFARRLEDGGRGQAPVAERFPTRRGEPDGGQHRARPYRSSSAYRLEWFGTPEATDGGSKRGLSSTLSTPQAFALGFLGMGELEPNFSIVVVGAMNPSIHHPFWYEILHALSQAEARDAVGGSNLLVSPMVAQFSWSGWTMVCLPERWEMRTQDPEKFGRVLDLAVLVFERLNDTPVKSFGINVDRVETKSESATRALACALHDANLGVSADASDGSFSTSTTVEKTCTLLRRTVTVSVSAKAPSVLRISNNFHHDVVMEEGMFNLTPLLRDGVDEALALSATQVADISSAFPWRRK